MKSINQSLLFLFIAALMSSCFSLHQGTISSDVVESNMNYVETVSGEAKSTIVFGFGGIEKNSLVQKAKSQMEVSRFLKPNERYINYTVDRQNTFYFGLVTVQRIILHADIVLINQDEDNPMSQEFRKEYFNLKPSDNTGRNADLFFKEMDKVLLADGTEVTILKIKGSTADVYVQTGDGYIKKTYDTAQLFSKSVYAYKSIQLGDKIDISDKVGKENTMGEVVGFRKDFALVKYNKNEHTLIRI